MNKKDYLSKKNLFIDYTPDNALKQELGKHFKLLNKRIYERYVSKKLIEKRKVVES